MPVSKIESFKEIAHGCRYCSINTAWFCRRQQTSMLCEHMAMSESGSLGAMSPTPLNKTAD